MKKDFQPNWTDPRTLARAKKAYGFARACMSETKPRSWARNMLDKHFGQQQNDLPNYLRKMLLICTNHHFAIGTNQCKQYVLNPAGMEKLRNILMNSGMVKDVPVPVVLENTGPDYLPDQAKFAFDQQIVAEFCVRQFNNELEAQQFTYEDKSGRLWHPIQNIRRDFKRQVLSNANLKHQYDINCAAPSLILQFAKQKGMKHPGEFIQAYIDNKEAIRHHIADIAEIDIKTAKVIVNALFCGARLSANPNAAIYQLLGYDRARVMVLQDDAFLTCLKEDIKMCWVAIEPSVGTIYYEKCGRMRKKAMNSKRKWGVYFDLERKVLDAARKYLKLTENGCFLEHDGFAATEQVDLSELENYIEQQTGLRVSYSEEILT